MVRLPICSYRIAVVVEGVGRPGQLLRVETSASEDLSDVMATFAAILKAFDERLDPTYHMEERP